MKNRKNEAKIDVDLFNFLKNKREFSNSWNLQKQDNQHIQSVLDISSKQVTGKNGFPDLIYVNESRRILIFVENKPDLSSHSSSNRDKPIQFSVDGTLHYLSFFLPDSLSSFNKPTQKYEYIITPNCQAYPGQSLMKIGRCYMVNVVCM